MSGRSFSEDTRKWRMEYSIEERNRNESDDDESDTESTTNQPPQIDKIQPIVGYAVALSRALAHYGKGNKQAPFFRQTCPTFSTKIILLTCKPFSLLFRTALVVTTPFLASSFIETVQSDISSEKPGVFDFIKEGISRLTNWGLPHSRLLPLWQLVPPTVFLGLSSYMIVQLARYTVLTTYRLEEQETRNDNYRSDDGEIIKSMYDKHFPNLLANFTGYFIADMMLYPFETVLHRLYLEGTRPILDNMDTGLDVVPIGTNYKGFIDGFQQILSEDEMIGLQR
ncbi:hypothetical protein KUTeg_017783 [Tegillarca granosa]|uniref:Uncharacterized protein n=1 Tax=Tegillarca granosa TaxID=220873 RepID=A0ABQ9ELB7_TEGGR|nr:hypothetical protein KUTeg_017783 [Tegillarca granosa]